MAHLSLEAFFSRIPVNNETTIIWDNLMFLPPLSEIPSISEFISPKSFENSAIPKNIFLIKQIHERDLFKILGFILLEYAFLSRKYPDYLLEVISYMRNNDNSTTNNEMIRIFRSFFEFLALLYFLKNKSKEEKIIEKKLQDLFNKSEYFNLGCGLFLKSFLCILEKKPVKKEEFIAMNNENFLSFINNFIDFSIFPEENMHFVIDLQSQIIKDYCVSKEFKLNYLLYSKEYISFLFNNIYEDNDDSRNLSLKLQKQLSSSYEKQSFYGFKSEKKEKIQNFKRKKTKEICENDECQQKLADICFINPSCNHHFCNNCLENAVIQNEETIFCLKNYCFSTINPNNIKDFFDKNYDFMNEIENNSVKNDLQIFNNKDNSNTKHFQKEYYCENAHCKSKKTDKMLRNEVCGHCFCEQCLLFIAKGGFLCLKNYCFAKWSEQLLNEFLGNYFEDQSKDTNNISFVMQNFGWINEIPN